MDSRACPIDGGVSRGSVGLVYGRPVEHCLIILGIELHEKCLPLLDQLEVIDSVSNLFLVFCHGPLAGM